MGQIRIGILTCARARDPLLVRAVVSVDRQTYSNWVHVVMCDDRTCGGFSSPSWGIRVVGGGEGYRGAAGNIWHGMSHIMANRCDVAVLLDGDDQLMPDALEIVSQLYDRQDTWVTHGSYMTESGRPALCNGPYLSGDNIRASRWRGSHLKTFRCGLWKHFREEWLQDRRRQWLASASDLALMFPLLEMAGPDHRRYCEDVVYVYNDMSEHNDHKVHAKEQRECAAYLRTRPMARRVGQL